MKVCVFVQDTTASAAFVVVLLSSSSSSSSSQLVLPPYQVQLQLKHCGREREGESTDAHWFYFLATQFK